jgi:PAS domain-containing protein
MNSFVEGTPGEAAPSVLTEFIGRAFNATTIGMVIVDAHGRIAVVNSRLQRMLGYDLERGGVAHTVHGPSARRNGPTASRAARRGPTTFSRRVDAN